MAAAVQEAQKHLDALETLSSKNLKQVLAETLYVSVAAVSLA